MDKDNERPEDRFVGYIGEAIENERLQCKDCMFCIKENTLECEKYEEKPAKVLKGESDCEFYAACGQ